MNKEIQPENHPDYTPREAAEVLENENNDTENTANYESIMLSDDLELTMQALKELHELSKRSDS